MSGGNFQRAKLRNAAFVGAALAAVLLVIAVYLNPKAAAGGWLVGFAFWAQILVGSLTLTMIHRLTSGRWGEIIAPAIVPAAAALPLLILLAVPLFIAIPKLYPWPQHLDTIKPDVLLYYLNVPSFIVRSVLALVGWSALALLLRRVRRPRGQLIAALGLTFHALVISSVSIDWYLSLEVPFNSSSFGASVAISSLVAALAWAALVVSVPVDDPALGDLGALLLATVLGITYIDFMAVLVIWYGDLPREAIWFVERDQFPWPLLAAAAFVLVSLFPVLALLLSQVRNARWPLRAVGGCVLVGMAAYDIYLIAPPAGGVTILPALLSVIGIGLALIGTGLSGLTTFVSSLGTANAQ